MFYSNPEDRSDVIALAVGMLGVAPGSENLNDLSAHFNSGGTLQELADSVVDLPIFHEVYPQSSTNEEFAEQFVTQLSSGLLATDDQNWAVDWVVGELNAGRDASNVMVEAIAALRGTDHSSPTFGAAAAAFENKIEVAEYYSVDLGRSGDLAEMQAVISGVDDTDESVEEAKQDLDNTDGGQAGEVFLSVSQDTKSGTGGDDLFIADVVQNDGGAQVNTLGSGDRLNGLGGDDTLEAQVAPGASWGFEGSAIAPRTTNVENVYLESVNTFLGLGVGEDTNSTTYVNASDMTGLETVWSDYSSGNLTIQNLTTYDDAGNLRLPSELTLGMRYTGSNDTNWDESDYNVYFAPNNLIRDVEETTTPSQANYWLLDQDSVDYDTVPLANIDRGGVFFKLDGVQYVLQVETTGEDENVEVLPDTWEQYAQDLRDAIAQQVADGVEELSGLEVTVDPGNPEQTFNDAGALVTIPAITITDANGGEFTDLGFTIPELISGEFNVFGRVGTEASETETSEFVTTNVALEKVGRGADGGEMVVGSMDKDGDNEYNGKIGVEQFNVQVLGDDALPSSLSGLRSTNNSLQIVNIESVTDADTYASLAIGNSNSSGYGLKDVREVNAADMQGDLSISAGITTESLPKYLNLVDTDANGTVDNSQFSYNLTGSGNNMLMLDVAQEVAVHEDFDLDVNGGSGHDYFNVSLDSGSTSQASWYQNQSALNNVEINSGAGHDTIWTPGGGDVIINAGSGSDTVYTDNTGSQTIVNAPGISGAMLPNGSEVKAHWVTNADNTNIHDLQGSGMGGQYFLYNTTVTVTLSGASVTGAGGVTTGAGDSNANGFEVTVDVPTGPNHVATHMDINQAIKDAINNNGVMNELLMAEDGPNNSLVISALIDGEFEASDLEIELNGPSAASLATLTGTQLTNLSAAYGDFTNDSTFTFADGTAVAGTVAGEAGSATAGYQGIGGSSLATDGAFVPGSPEVQEVQTIDVTDLIVPAGGGGDITVDGVTVTLAPSSTDAQIAAAIQADLDAAGSGTSGTYGTVTVSGSVVTVTYALGEGDVPEIVAASGTATLEANASPTPEQQTLDFSYMAGGVQTDGNIGVGGILVNVDAGDTSADVAAAVAAAIDGATLNDPLANVTAVDVTGDVVTVTISADDGDVADINVVNGSATFLVGEDPNAQAGAEDGTETQAYDPVGSGDPATAEDDVIVTTETEGALAVAPVGTGVVISGEDSTALTGNIIDLGTGEEDVVVLSTSAEAEETLVWNGYGNGNNTIVNFDDEGGENPGADLLDFSDYLTSQTSASGSTLSEMMVGVSLDVDDEITANEVVVTDFTTSEAAGSWSTLSVASLEAGLNGNGTFSIDVNTDFANPGKAVFMIENEANAGEYKLFDVEIYDGNGDASFDVLGMIGVADFGNSLNSLTDANLVG